MYTPQGEDTTWMNKNSILSQTMPYCADLKEIRAKTKVANGNRQNGWDYWWEIWRMTSRLLTWGEGKSVDFYSIVRGRWFAFCKLDLVLMRRISFVSSLSLKKLKVNLDFDPDKHPLSEECGSKESSQRERYNWASSAKQWKWNFCERSIFGQMFEK